MLNDELKKQFPNLLKTEYKITSLETEDYNCIAWAAGDTEAWWWPDSMGTEYWPNNIERSETLASFVKAFETLSYSVCDSAEYENGFEKIAIYTDANGKPTHAARQLKSGQWTSKLGRSFDIKHECEGVAASNAYGNIAVIMKRSS